MMDQLNKIVELLGEISAILSSIEQILNRMGESDYLI